MGCVQCSGTEDKGTAKLKGLKIILLEELIFQITLIIRNFLQEVAKLQTSSPNTQLVGTPIFTQAVFSGRNVGLTALAVQTRPANALKITAFAPDTGYSISLSAYKLPQIQGA